MGIIRLSPVASNANSDSTNRLSVLQVRGNKENTTMKNNNQTFEPVVMEGGDHVFIAPGSLISPQSNAQN